MQQAVSARTPAHLWIVGILALLWNCFGAYDYTMSRMRDDGLSRIDVPAAIPTSMLAYMDALPIYAKIGWGLGVWAALLGSVLLLMRSRYAVHAFGLSLIGSILGLGYQLAKPMPGVTGFMASGLPIIIIAIALALFLYARGSEKRACCARRLGRGAAQAASRAASGGAGDDAVEVAVERALGFEQFVIDLQTEEEAFRHPEVARQPQVELRVHRCGPINHCPQSRGIGVDRPRERVEAKAKRLHKFTDEQLAGVGIVQPIGVSDSR